MGVVHINDPFSESSGYSYAHQAGIEEMKRKTGLKDSQMLYKINVDDQDFPRTESAIRDLIAEGANIVIATAEGYAKACEKLADEYPNAIFTQLYTNSRNNFNLTNYFGRVYQARYLSGIIAGLQTRTNKIGFVAAWGKENGQVTSGLNAFAMGVEKVNPRVKVYVKVTHSWHDPMGEGLAARALIAAGCDVIAQHCDASTPQVEAEKAGVWGIGYNNDMSVDAPSAVLTSVIWRWGAYYTILAQSVIDGTFTTSSYFGSLKDGIVDISPLNKNLNKDLNWKPEIIRVLVEERRRIESGAFDVFSGVLETNDGRRIGKAAENLSDDETRSGINWYYRTISEP
ncbi:MAG: BMP family ABC transporter substrate-binding protein [Leptospirales bacterium]|nr:BMP family ABC transporter substrate-binding protein [Leptospirales bacterium]